MSSTSGPILSPRSTCISCRADDRDDVALADDEVGRGFDDLRRRAATRTMKTRASSGSASSSRHRLVEQIRIRHAVGADVEGPAPADITPFHASGRASDRGLHPRGLLTQVDAHQLRPDRGKVPDEAAVPMR